LASGIWSRAGGYRVLWTSRYVSPLSALPDADEYSSRCRHRSYPYMARPPSPTDVHEVFCLKENLLPSIWVQTAGTVGALLHRNRTGDGARIQFSLNYLTAITLIVVEESITCQKHIHVNGQSGIVIARGGRRV